MYGKILQGTRTYPMLRDSSGAVLSFPPIINGNVTKVDTGTKNMLIDVTSTDQRVGEDALAIICAALSDAGGDGRIRTDRLSRLPGADA